MSQVIIGGGDQQAVSKKALQDAASDAMHLMQNSPIIPKLVAVDVICRRIFLVIRQGLENEVIHGWEVERPDLVMKVLGMSAQEKSVADPASPFQLRKELLETVLPVLDAFCEMELQRNAKPETVSGDDTEPPAGLGEVPGGAAGDSQQEAGERAGRDCGEASPA